MYKTQLYILTFLFVLTRERNNLFFVIMSAKLELYIEYITN